MVLIPWAAWTTNDARHLPALEDGERNIVRPSIQFHLVDSDRRLVRVEEQSWQDHVDT